MDGYVFEAELDDRQRHQLVAMTHEPGETVRLHPNVAGQRRERLEEMADRGDGTLRIRTVIVTRDVKVEYEFEGIEGRFDGAYVTDARDIAWLYGALVRAGDQTWAVELEPGPDEPRVDRILRISGAPEKHVAYERGIRTEEGLAGFAGGSCGVKGEFALADRGDGSWALVRMSRTTGMPEGEREVAREAVEAAMSPARRLH